MDNRIININELDNYLKIFFQEKENLCDSLKADLIELKKCRTDYIAGRVAKSIEEVERKINILLNDNINRKFDKVINIIRDAQISVKDIDYNSAQKIDCFSKKLD